MNDIQKQIEKLMRLNEEGNNKLVPLKQKVCVMEEQITVLREELK